jgi:hypothetical protein
LSDPFASSPEDPSGLFCGSVQHPQGFLGMRDPAGRVDARGDPEPFINNVLATSALAMLARLLRYGTLDHHGAFYNAASGRSVPMPIDPDFWEKQVKLQR